MPEPTTDTLSGRRARSSPLAIFVSVGITLCVVSSFFTTLATPVLLAIILIAVLFLRELNDLLIILFPIALINPQLRLGAAGMVVTDERSFHPINVNMTELFIGGILLAWLMRGRNREGERAGSPFLLPLVALLVLTVVGIVVAEERNTGIKIAFEKMIEPLILVFVMTRIRWSRARLQLALTALIVSAAAVAGKSLFDWFFRPETSRLIEGDRGVIETVRLHSSWAATNIMAAFFGMVAPAVFLRIFYGPKGRARLWNVIAFGLLALGLAITQTRAGYLAAVVVLVALSLKYRRGWLMVGVVAIALASYGTAEMFDRAQSILRATSDFSFRSRIEVWSDSLDMLMRAPLTGIGFGSFSAIYRDPLGNVHPHNDYLLLALEMGILGLLAFLVMLAKTFGALRRARKFASSAEDRITLDALTGGLVVFLLQSNLECLLSWTVFNFAFWFFIGLSAMYARSLELDRADDEARSLERMRARPALAAAGGAPAGP